MGNIKMHLNGRHLQGTYQRRGSKMRHPEQEHGGDAKSHRPQVEAE